VGRGIVKSIVEGLRPGIDSLLHFSSGGLAQAVAGQVCSMAVVQYNYRSRAANLGPVENLGGFSSPHGKVPPH